MSTSALELNKLFHQQVGDYIAVQVTTNITTSALIVSTALQQYDGGRDSYFVDWWAYITDKNNAGVDRKVKNYYTSNATMEVWGASFSADTVPANVRVHRYCRVQPRYLGRFEMGPGGSLLPPDIDHIRDKRPRDDESADEKRQECVCVHT